MNLLNFFTAVNGLSCFHLFSVFGGGKKNKKKINFSSFAVLSVVVLKQNKFYLLPSFSLQVLTLPSSTLCCPVVAVASQPISPNSVAVRRPSSCQVSPSFSAPSLLSQARMRTGLSGVNRHSDGEFECMTSLGSNPNILLHQGSWECELRNNSDGRHWQVFGLGELWLAFHSRNDSSCKIIPFQSSILFIT